MFFKWLKRTISKSGHDAPSAFHTQSAFLAMVERERLRCDRNGGCFALVSVTLTHLATLGRDLKQLADLLQKRLRSTDDIGMIEVACAGALLPDTGTEGARKVASDLRDALNSEGISSQVRVLTYPTENEAASPVGAAGVLTEHHAVVPVTTLLAQALPPWKRVIDVTGAGVGLVLLSPILLLVAACVKYSSPGPIFYRQRREGLAGREFDMLKFRTMVVEADDIKAALLEHNEQDGPAFKIENDPRVTRIGRWLRSSSVDELPQLVNVLRGDMSLVGPRPLPVEESQACTQWQRRRLDVTPGLTCLWQVKDRRIKIAFNDWMRMDLTYVSSRTLRHDLKLLVLTVRAVMLRSWAE